jgi:Predicted membrane protein
MKGHNIMPIFKHSKLHETYLFISLAASISGFCDVFCFLSLNKLFTAHITGNIVILLSFILDKKYDYIPQLMSIPIFVLVSILITIILKKQPPTKRIFLLWILLEFFLFLALLISGITILPYHSISHWYGIMISIIPIIAMSIHNTVLKTYVSGLPPVYAMTGNLIQLTVDSTSLLFHLKKKNSTIYNHHLCKSKHYGNVLFGFLAGGFIGAGGYILMRFYALIFILILIATLAVLIKFND